MYSQPNARRGGLAHHLDGLTLERVLDGLLGKRTLQSWIVDCEAVETLIDHLYRHTGIDAAFLNLFLGEDPYTFDSVGDAFAGWLICIDLQNFEKEPDSSTLPLYPSHSLRKTCGRLLTYLRDRYPETYAQKAQLVAVRLSATRQLQPEILDFNIEDYSHAQLEAVCLSEAQPILSVRPLTDWPQPIFRVEAEALPAVLGFNRLRVRLRCLPADQSGLSTAGTRDISLGLRVPDRPDIRLTVQEASGADLTDQRVHLPVNSDWVEIFFDLRGERNEQVQVEVLHPEGIEDVTPILLPDYFAVLGSGQEAALLVTATDNWQIEIADPAIRSVFVHLYAHGSLTESELIGFLGSARNARRFAKDFNELVQMLPFSVRIETNSSGKRYVRHD